MSSLKEEREILKNDKLNIDINKNEFCSYNI